MKKMADVWRENDVLVKRILGDERILVDAWVRGNLVIPSSVEPRKERKFLAPMLQGFSAHRYGWKMILEGENGARMVLRYCPGEWNVKAFLEDPPHHAEPSFVIASAADVETLFCFFSEETEMATPR